MAGATYYNLKQLCYIDDMDFTDFQGVGSDPLYRRYENLKSVVNARLPERYRDFLARPHAEEGQIFWFVPEWQETPQSLSSLDGADRLRYTRLKDETLKAYNDAMNRLAIEERAMLVGALKYVSDDFIYCYDERIVLIAWGMRPDTSKHEVNGSWVKGLKYAEKVKVIFNPGEGGELVSPLGRVISREKGHKLVPRDVPQVTAKPGFTFLGWNPTIRPGLEVKENMTFTAVYKQAVVEEPKTTATVTFVPGVDGSAVGELSFEVPLGTVIEPTAIPIVQANSGRRFTGWSPSPRSPIEGDTTFTAGYESTMAHCLFRPGEHGILQGSTELNRPLGVSLLATEVPIVKPHKGYKFKGWDINPFAALTGDSVFTAQYEKKLPWYKRFWLWLTTGSCLSRLLWGLLALLLLGLLVFFLTKGCVGCAGLGVDRLGHKLLPVDSVEQIDRVVGSDGRERDNNGEAESILDGDGDLPEGTVTAPIVGEDGQMPPIIDNEGSPDVVANRLNVFFENENADLNKWAHDFKQLYPGENYQIIGVDPNTKLIQIMIPERERDKIREELPKRITDQPFFVLDESIMTLQGSPVPFGAASTSPTAAKGWHHQAIHTQQAWATTAGRSDVVIAVVDDGIDAGHPMFRGRFHNAYNVFTQNRALSRGAGHGTHVAGLAAGSAEGMAQGLAGVAPNCRLMPVQVFDNGMCTFSSLAAGIMYAIHNGASVVNISVGPSFAGASALPPAQQQQIAASYFKNEEKVYRRIIETANRKNVILVFAAGNDNILTAILPECRMTAQTINVAACDQNLQATDFTNYASGTNISAPGKDILSAFPVNSSKVMDGTSMAAPIVSGAVALMRSLKPDLTVGQAIGVLQQTGQPIPQYIPPMIQLDRALAAVKSGQIPNGPVASVPDQIRHEGGQPVDIIVDSTAGVGDIVVLPGEGGGAAGSSPVDDGAESGGSVGGGNNGQPVGNAGTQPGRGGNRDDYSALRDLLKQLKQQRDDLNRRIDEVEQKIK